MVSVISSLIKFNLHIFHVYFTCFPHMLYTKGNCSGNMAIAGIGLRLMNCQKMFWISNILICILFFTKNKYLNAFLYTMCIYLYTRSLATLYFTIPYVTVLVNKYPYFKL